MKIIILLLSLSAVAWSQQKPHKKATNAKPPAISEAARVIGSKAFQRANPSTFSVYVRGFC